MLIGVESQQVLAARHIAVASLSGLLVYLFYLSYTSWGVEPALWPDWSQDHPFWRAWAHAAFELLFLILVLAPLAVLHRPVRRLLPWRRELGIWFAVLSLGHAYAIWDRWAGWDVATLFGFEHVDELGGYVLLRPEVGMMNVIGHQVYRASERTLHIAERDGDSDLTWMRVDNVEANELGLVDAVLEPATWAAQYGLGTHRIATPAGSVDVTIARVEEPIEAAVFEIVEDAEHP